MLFAMEAHDRIVHGEQHLDAVVVFLGVSAFALRLWQLLLQSVESVGQLGDTKVCDWKQQRFTAMQTMAFCFSIIKNLLYATNETHSQPHLPQNMSPDYRKVSQQQQLQLQKEICLIWSVMKQ